MANEKRLIDANVLTELVEKEQSKYENNGYDDWLNGIYLGLDKCIDKIEDAPTVDAVEVVRCKDCKHFVAPQGVPCCNNFYGLGFPNANGNDFCSYGERKDNDWKRQSDVFDRRSRRAFSIPS